MSRATYAELGDACLTAHSMELIGARWTYPILRELMLGPKRFSDLLANVRGVTPAVLTGRLREMRDAGLVVIEELSPANVNAYALTRWALELAPILRELGRWGQSSSLRTAEGGLTPDSAIQAMITMAGDGTLDPPITAELRLHDERVDNDHEHPYSLRWGQTGLAVERGTAANPDVVIRCDSSSWGHIMFNDRTLNQAGAVTSGESALATRLISEFRRNFRLQPTS